MRVIVIVASNHGSIMFKAYTQIGCTTSCTTIQSASIQFVHQISWISKYRRSISYVLY